MLFQSQENIAVFKKAGPKEYPQLFFLKSAQIGSF
jgi:hypothetical protein